MDGIEGMCRYQWNWPAKPLRMSDQRNNNIKQLVVNTNLEPSSVIDLDAKKWPDAPVDDASSYYKVCMEECYGAELENLCPIFKFSDDDSDVKKLYYRNANTQELDNLLRDINT